jgi:hypothetical protein
MYIGFRKAVKAEFKGIGFFGWKEKLSLNFKEINQKTS